MIKKQEYLDYIKKAVEYGRAHYNQNIKKWEESFAPNHFFGYNSPSHVPLQAHIEGFMYSLTKKYYINNISFVILLVF